jgi:hypothetical protein
VLRLLRRVLGLLGTALAGAIAAGFTVYVLQARGMPALHPWHDPLPGEFRAGHADEGWDGYAAREEKLFAKLEARIEKWSRDDPSGPVSRYQQGSRAWPPGYAERAGLDHDWNRSVALEVSEPRGAVLLIHGLSDSPYSMRALAELFRERGFDALALRVPGHGTVPGALDRAREQDWRAAVRVAARRQAERAGGGPFWIAGYSNGAALAVDYTLGALEDGDDPAPSDLLLLSPAIAVTPLAALARFQRRLAFLPGLEKLAWVPILLEFDPYKYNSFPVRAGERIRALTGDLHARLEKLGAGAPVAGFPRVLAFVSVVDDTVPPSSVATHLLDRLVPNGSELVVFDVNHVAVAADLVQALQGWLEALRARPAPYRVTVVTNAAADSTSVMARSRPAGAGEWSEAPLGLVWPPAVYSLSHVAMPIPPEDPLYGTREAARGSLPLGSLELRGERGVLHVPMDQLMRLRHNPFFPYLAERVREALGP